VRTGNRVQAPGVPDQAPDPGSVNRECQWCTGTGEMIVVWLCPEPGCDNQGAWLLCALHGHWCRSGQGVLCAECGGRAAWVSHELATGEQIWVIPS
jgi:hypothetical protein